MIDLDKLNYVQRYINEYTQTWETWDDFKQFLNNITKSKVKTFLKNRLVAEQASGNEVITNEQGKIDTLADLNTELNNL